MQKRLKRSGFTLIEMTVVLFIISLLILIIIPNINRARENANNKDKDAMTSMVKTQASSYLTDHDNQGTVTLQKLLDDHYLSGRQFHQAQKDGIKSNEEIHEDTK